MPGSWQIDVAFCRPNGLPCVEGVSDVLCGVVECKRSKGTKNQSSSKTSHLAYSTLHRHVSFVFKSHRIFSLLHIRSSSGLFRWRANSFSVAHAKVRSDLKSLSCLFEAKVIFLSECLPEAPPPSDFAEGCLMQLSQTIK